MAYDRAGAPQGDVQFDRGFGQNGGRFDVLALHQERNNALNFRPGKQTGDQHLPGLELVDSSANPRDAVDAQRELMNQQMELVLAQQQMMRMLMELAMMIQRMNPEQLKLFSDFMRNLMFGGQPGDQPSQPGPTQPGSGGGGDRPTQPGTGGVKPPKPGNGGGDKPRNPGAGGGGDKPTNPGNGGGDKPTNPGNGGGDKPTNPGNGGGDKPTNPGNGGGDKPTKPGDKPVDAPDDKPVGGKVIWRVDADHTPKDDKNLSYSIDDNKKNFGGSSVKFLHDKDGDGYINFKVDRWPNLPEGWEKNPPSNVSQEQLEEMKKATSYRAELTSYQEEDRFKPGHTYEVKFDNQLAKWDHDKSAWGDIFFQMHQSAPYGVPEFALGTKQGKYAVMLNGHWQNLDLPPVDQTIGDWQDWKVKMTMPKEDGSGGKLQVVHDGKVVYTNNDWDLKTGYGQGNPYVKVGIYKAVYHEDENGKYTGTGGSRHRELNVGSFAVTDISG